MRKRAAIILSAAVFEAVATSCGHAALSWINNASGSWSQGANWSGGSAPASGSVASIAFSANNGSLYAFQNVSSPFIAYFVDLTGNTAVTSTLDGSPIRFERIYDRNPYLFLNNYSSSARGSFVVKNEIRCDVNLSVNGSYGGSLTLNNGTGSGTLNLVNNVFAAGTLGFTGGVRIGAGSLTVIGNGRLLNTPVTMQSSGPGAQPAVLTLASSAVGGSTKLRVRDVGIVNFASLDAAALASIAPNSTGVIAISSASFTGATLAMPTTSAVSLGTSTPDYAGLLTISATVTPAGNTYRFGGQLSPYVQLFGAPRLIVTSPLINNGTTPRSLVIGATGLPAGRVTVNNPSNSFTGGTTVLYSSGGFTALSIISTPTAGQTPFGTGSINVLGTLVCEGGLGSVGTLPNSIVFQPGSTLLLSNLSSSRSGVVVGSDGNHWPDARAIALNGTTLDFRIGVAPTEVVGSVSFAGGSRVLIRSTNYDSSPVNNDGTLDFARLETIPTASLTFPYASNQTLRVRDTSAVLNTASGMITPAVIAETYGSDAVIRGDFVAVNPAQRLVPFAYAGTFSSANTEVVASTSSLISSSNEAWAWRATGASTLATGATLTLRSGGLILNDSASVAGGVVTMYNGGLVEGRVYTNPGSNATISSSFRANSLTKFGAGTLTLLGINTFNANGVDVNEGFLHLAVSQMENSAYGYRVRVGPNASIAYSGFHTLGDVTGARDSTFWVNAGGGVNIETLDAADVQISPGAAMTIRFPYNGQTPSARVAKLKSLGLAPGGKLDLTNNTLLVDYTGTTYPYAYRRNLAAGYGNGAWNGTGMLSSTVAAKRLTLGFADAGDLFSTFPATVDGASVDDTTLIIRPTLVGDANLDRTVNSLDFGLMIASYGKSDTYWHDGDFNYSEGVDSLDFAMLISGFGRTFSFAGELPGATVPEPLAALTLLAPLLLKRRRSRFSETLKA